MVGETLKSLIGRLNTSEELDKLPAMLAAALNTYDSTSDFHPNFRRDMLDFITASVELCTLMADDEYDASEVVRRAFKIMSVLPGFIKQAEDSKLATVQYAIQNKATRARLPSVFTTKAEAEVHLKSMAAMVDVSQLEVITIRVSLVTGSPPRAVAPPLTVPQISGAGTTRDINSSSGGSAVAPPFEVPGPEAPLTTQKPETEH